MRIEITDTTEEQSQLAWFYAWDCFGVLMGVFESQAKALGAASRGDPVEDITEGDSRYRVLRRRLTLRDGRVIDLFAAFDNNDPGLDQVGVRDPREVIVAWPTLDRGAVDAAVDAAKEESKSSPGP